MRETVLDLGSTSIITNETWRYDGETEKGYENYV